MAAPSGSHAKCANSKSNLTLVYDQGLTMFRSLLKNKDRVVLYVAHNNPAAAKVYDRVGFLGLGPTSAPVEGVDSWLELGFDRKHVTLGHW